MMTLNSTNYTVIIWLALRAANNHGQTSWDKQSRVNSCTLVQPQPHPLQCWTRVHAQISPEFQHCIEGKATHFETNNSAFSKLCFKNSED